MQSIQTLGCAQNDIKPMKEYCIEIYCIIIKTKESPRTANIEELPVQMMELESAEKVLISCWGAYHHCSVTESTDETGEENNHHVCNKSCLASLV